MRKLLFVISMIVVTGCTTKESEMTSGIEISVGEDTFLLYPVDESTPMIGETRFDSEVSIIGDQVAVYIQPAADSRLYQQLFILNIDELVSEQKLPLSSEAHFSRYENVKFDPAMWEEIALLSTQSSSVDIESVIGPCDLVFFIDSEIMGQSLAEGGGRLHFLESPFPNVKYVWVEMSSAFGGQGKLASINNHPTSFVSMTYATHIPWQVWHSASHYFHAHLPIVEEWLGIVFDETQVQTELRIAMHKPALRLQPGVPDSFKDPNQPQVIVTPLLEESSNLNLSGTIYYVAKDNEGPDRIEAVDLKTGEVEIIRSYTYEFSGTNPLDDSSVEYEYPEDIHGIAISDDGSKLAFINYIVGVDGVTQFGYFTLSVIDLTSGEVEELHWVMQAAYDYIHWMGSPAWSHDGNKIAYIVESQIFDDDDAPRNLYVEYLQISNDEINWWAPLGNINWPGRMSWTESGAFIGAHASGGYFPGPDIQPIVEIFNNENYNLHFFEGNPNSNSTTQVAKDPQWSQDGSKVVFSYTDTPIIHSEQFDIYIIDADGTSNLKQITSGMERDTYPHWSPDEKNIVFVRRFGDEFIDEINGELVEPIPIFQDDLWVVNIDTGELSKITDTPNITEEYPIWIGDRELNSIGGMNEESMVD